MILAVWSTDPMLMIHPSKILQLINLTLFRIGVSANSKNLRKFTTAINLESKINKQRKDIVEYTAEFTAVHNQRFYTTSCALGYV